QLAQASTSQATKTLYVTGTGQISAPADQAMIMMSFYPNSYYSDYSNPDATPAQPQVLASDITNATEAATAAGATNVKVSPDLSSPGSMRIRMVLNQPTPDKVEQLLTAINTAVVKTNRYVSSGATVGYTIRDCQALEASARQAAMTDATERATALAGVSNTRLGEMISVSESVSWGNNYSAICPSSNDPTIFADLYSLPYYDPAAPAAVRLTYSLSVTYGLE
ncbi:MAG: SIMPL domain-containing protein, partial [Elainella sp.]